MSALPSPKPAGPAAYNLAKAQGICSHCARAIATGEKFTAALRETPASLERLDLCPQCWTGFDRAGLLAFWQATMQSPAKKRLLVDDEVLAELFERLAEVAEPEKLNFRFVLGLILMRKKRLAYESSRQQEGREIWSMRVKGSDRVLELVNPRLDQTMVAQVSSQMDQILSTDL